jgi:hypothetical protein
LYAKNLYCLNTRLAHLLSTVLHPLLMPTILFILLFFRAPTSLGVDAFDSRFKWFIIAMIFVYTFALPSYLIYLMYRWGMIQSIRLENLEERRLPYLLTAIIYILLGYFIYTKNALLFPSAYILWSIASVIFLVGIISFWWQISAHAAGVGGMIGTLAGLISRFGESALFIPMLCLIVFAGFLLSARLQLNAHTPAQVGAGVVLGILMSFSSILFLF